MLSGVELASFLVVACVGVKLMHFEHRRIETGELFWPCNILCPAISGDVHDALISLWNSYCRQVTRFVHNIYWRKNCRWGYHRTLAEEIRWIECAWEEEFCNNFFEWLTTMAVEPATVVIFRQLNVLDTIQNDWKLRRIAVYVLLGTRANLTK